MRAGKRAWTTIMVLACGLWACQSQPAVLPPALIADPPEPTEGGRSGAVATELDRALAFVERGQWEMALKHLDKALAQAPDDAEVHYYWGLAHHKLGDLGKAESGFSKAIALDGGLSLARAHLGELYLLGEKIRAKEAIAVLEPAVKTEPKDADTRQLLAFAYRVQRDFDKSAAQYEASLALEESSKVRFDYSDMLFEARRMEAAVAQMRRVKDAYAKDARMLGHLGRRFGQAKAYADCVGAFEQAIVLKPKQAPLYLHRGICRHQLGDEAAARADYQLALGVDGKLQAAHYYLGRSWLVSKQRSKAIMAFTRAVKLAPASKVGKRAQAKLDEMSGKTK